MVTQDQHLEIPTVQENKQKTSGMSRSTRKTLTFYAFISPWLIGFILLTIIPLVVGVWLSFTNYNGLNFDNIRWVGTAWYERVPNDRQAMESLQIVFAWTALNTPIWLVLSFVLAYLLSKTTKFRGFFRTVWYLPSIIPLVAVAWSWRTLLHQSYGLVNQTINIFAPGVFIGWLSEHALISLTMISVWMGLGNGIIIFLAGLQDVSSELEDAAAIDGASRFQIFRHIIIPLMTPVIFFQLVQSIVFAMQMFALPLLLAPNQASNAGVLSTPPQNDVYLFMIYAFQQIFQRQRFGYGIALIWILFGIIVAMTLILFWSRRFWVWTEMPESKKHTRKLKEAN